MNESLYEIRDVFKRLGYKPEIRGDQLIVHEEAGSLAYDATVELVSLYRGLIKVPVIKVTAADKIRLVYIYRNLIAFAGKEGVYIFEDDDILGVGVSFRYTPDINALSAQLLDSMTMLTQFLRSYYDQLRVLNLSHS